MVITNLTIDMDGFVANRTFYCMELGLLRIGKAAARSFFFNLGICWSELSMKDTRTCSYVSQNIHKLPFGVPRGTEQGTIYMLD